MASDSEQLVRNPLGLCHPTCDSLTVKSYRVSRLCEVMGTAPIFFIKKNYIEHVFISQKSNKGLLGAARSVLGAGNRADDVH